MCRKQNIRENIATKQRHQFSKSALRRNAKPEFTLRQKYTNGKQKKKQQLQQPRERVGIDVYF